MEYKTITLSLIHIYLCPSVAGNLSGISITHLPLNMQLPKVTKNPCEKTVESV